MAISLLEKWDKIMIESTKDSSGQIYTFGEKLSGGSGNPVIFNSLAGGKQAMASGATLQGVGKTAVNVGLYEVNGGNVYAFATTATGTVPQTITGGYKLVATATATTGAVDSSTKDVALTNYKFTLASGANRTVQLASGANTKYLGVTGSAGDDSFMIKSLGSTSMAVDFSNGGSDKLYVSGSNTVGSLTGTSGKLSLIASADASSEGGVLVLGGNFSSSVVLDGNVGDTLTFGMSKNTSASFASSSGNVILKGSVSNDSVTIGELIGGKLAWDKASGKGKDTITINTVSGGTGTLNMDNQTAGTKVQLDLVKDGKIEVKNATGGLEIVASSITGGSVNVASTKGLDTITSSVTGGSLVVGAGNNTVTFASGTNLNAVKFGNSTTSITAGGLEITGQSGKMDFIASKTNGSVTIDGGSSATANLSLGALGAETKVVIKADSSADTLSVKSFGASAEIDITDNTGHLVLGSGSVIKNALLSSGGTNQINLEANASSGISVVGASVTGGNAQVKGSNSADYFDIQKVDSSNGITLTGGSGNDVYNFASGLEGGATITDFGWSTSAEEAKDSALGQDVIFVDDLESATLGKITYSAGTVYLGQTNVVATTTSTDNYVYAKIAKSGTEASDAQTYRIGASGAKAVGSDSPNEVKGSSGVFDASSQEHAYMNLGSGESTVKNMTAYNGENDRTASIIDTTMEFEDMEQTTDSNGNVTLTDGTNSVEIQSLGEGKAIKVGSKTSQEALVLGAATGVTTVEAGVGKESIATNYLGASGLGSIFDFSQTDKTTIDLSGNSTDDKATYKNVKGVKGSDNGGSLLVSGSSAVTLEAAGKSDTLSGAGAGNDTLVSASGKATNFLLSSGNGNDVVKNFQFGDGANADKVIIGASGFDYAESIISASNGKVKVGGENGTLSIDAAGKNYVQIQYNFGGDNPGTAIVDTSDGGSVLNFASGSNIILGQSGVTTVKAAAGDDVEPKNNGQPAGIGWNSNYVVANVGVVDVSASDMTAVNGQKNASDMVLAATGASLEGPIWVCGGIGENFSDTGNDTLVASGNGNNEIFVGAKMGNDIIQKVSSKDLITFIDTKVSDFGGINKVLTIDNTGFTAVFAGTAGTSTTIKGTTQLAMDKTTNLTFHFDDADYVWDGKTLTEATA